MCGWRLRDSKFNLTWNEILCRNLLWTGEAMTTILSLNLYSQPTVIGLSINHFSFLNIVSTLSKEGLKLNNLHWVFLLPHSVLMLAWNHQCIDLFLSFLKIADECKYIHNKRLQWHLEANLTCSGSDNDEEMMAWLQEPHCHQTGCI